MINRLLILLTLTLCIGCSTVWKTKQVPKGGIEEAANNAIVDFINTSSLSKHDSVFSLSFKEFENGVLGVNIYGVTIKESVVKEGNVIRTDVLPNRYTEQNGKLFYWSNSSTKRIDDEMITRLKRYNWLDTIILNAYIPDRMIKEDKKGATYYFCRDNLLKYKKVESRFAMGQYKVPDVGCSKQQSR